MKIYVFLAYAIGNMGGGQMFIRNKCLVLRQNGWTPIVIYGERREVIIKELKEYENNYIPEILDAHIFYSKKQKEDIVFKIKEILPESQNIIIESLGISLSMWGEIIAKKLKATHIINIIDEISYDKPSKRLTDYFKFKLERGEFLNASERSLRRFWGDKFDKSLLSHKFVMSPYCSNVTADIEIDIKLKPADFCISSIGRLDKEYVIPMFKEIVLFAKQNIEKQINVLIVGASPDGSVEKIIKEICNLDSITLYFFGYLNPIPNKLLSVLDIGIASSNSVLVTSNYGIPTISVDANDHDAIGLYNITTKRTVYRDQEPHIKISKLLSDVLIGNKYPQTKKLKRLEEGKILKEKIQPQIDFLVNIEKNHYYYNVNHIAPFYKRLFYIIRRKYLCF